MDQQACDMAAWKIEIHCCLSQQPCGLAHMPRRNKIKCASGSAHIYLLDEPWTHMAAQALRLDENLDNYFLGFFAPKLQSHYEGRSCGGLHNKFDPLGFINVHMNSSAQGMMLT